MWFRSCFPSESLLEDKTCPLESSIDIVSVPSQKKALYSALWRKTKVNQTHLAKGGLEQARDLVMSIDIYNSLLAC